MSEAEAAILADMEREIEEAIIRARLRLRKIGSPLEPARRKRQPVPA